MDWNRVRRTQSDGVARGIRVVLGVLFAMTGAMKLVVPMLAAAWAGQLAAANIPLAELNRLVVPVIEMGVGWVGDVGLGASGVGSAKRGSAPQRS